MRIVVDYPPNYAAIIAAFPAAETAKPIFAYGDVIYNPHRIMIGTHLMRHESVHGERQNGDPAAWWVNYIADPQFRLDEEVAAHAAEYQSMCAGITRNQRRRVLRMIARRLASPLYGSLCSIDTAKRLIAE